MVPRMKTHLKYKVVHRSKSISIYGYRRKEKEKITEKYFAKLCIFTSGWEKWFEVDESFPVFLPKYMVWKKQFELKIKTVYVALSQIQ